MANVQLSQLCNDIFGPQDIEISPEMNIRDIKNWDSFSHIQFVIAVENALGISFTPDEVQSVQTLAEFISIVEAKGGSLF